MEPGAARVRADSGWCAEASMWPEAMSRTRMRASGLSRPSWATAAGHGSGQAAAWRERFADSLATLVAARVQKNASVIAEERTEAV